jgi:bacterioferritin-associated ferredoxin
VYVCSCNVFTDTDVRAVAGIAGTVSQVYRTLGCQAQCGCCARTIKRLLDECRHEAGCGCDTICPPESSDCPAIERAIAVVHALEIVVADHARDETVSVAEFPPPTARMPQPVSVTA